MNIISCLFLFSSFVTGQLYSPMPGTTGTRRRRCPRQLDVGGDGELELERAAAAVRSPRGLARGGKLAPL